MRSPRAEPGFGVTAPLRPVTHLCASSSTPDTSADAMLTTGHRPIITIAQRPHVAGLTLPLTLQITLFNQHTVQPGLSGEARAALRESLITGVVIRQRVLEEASSIHGEYKAGLKHRVTQKTNNGRPCPNLYGGRFLNLDLPLSKALESTTSRVS